MADKNPSAISKSRALFAAAICAVILFGSFTRGPQIPLPFSIFAHDKIGHYFVFGLIATALCRVKPAAATHWGMGLFAVALTCLIGLTDETVQAANPDRYYELADLVMDTAGAITAVIVYQHWRAYRNLLEWRGFRKSKPRQSIQEQRNRAS